MTEIRVTDVESYNSLVRFYDVVAEKLGVDPKTVSSYDPKYIHVTKDVMDNLLCYMKETYKCSRNECNLAYMNLGPSMETIPGEHIVKVEKGFLKFDSPMGSRCIKPRNIKESIKKRRNVKAEKPPAKKKLSEVKKIVPKKKDTKPMSSKDSKPNNSKYPRDFGTVMGVLPEKTRRIR